MRKRVVYQNEDGREWLGWFDDADADLVYEGENYGERVWLTENGRKAHYAVKEDSDTKEFSRIPYSELAILLMEEPEYATEEGKVWLEEQALEIL